ncbi:hypothetical protein BGZ49_007201 [Haplosporangium sp. Z 27]|nr:hypothetical protein BGZ49_007201 [Haplosporangium sp. Z 27]
MKRSIEDDQNEKDTKKPRVSQIDNVQSAETQLDVVASEAQVDEVANVKTQMVAKAETQTDAVAKTETQANAATKTEVDAAAAEETKENTFNYSDGYTPEYMAMMYHYQQSCEHYYQYNSYYYYNPTASDTMAQQSPLEHYRLRHSHPYYAAQPYRAPGASNVMASGPPVIRTVYIGNIPTDTTIRDVLDLVKTGNIESAKLISSKNCAFISFIDPTSAVTFRNKATLKPLTINKQELSIGWGEATPVPPATLEAVKKGVTRNVYIGNIDDTVTKDTLFADLSAFGVIEDIKVIREKSIAFVHFTHIGSAMKAVATLTKDSRYSIRRISYGKDRCSLFATVIPEDNPAVPGLIGSGVPMSILTAENKRTVYLGNIAPDATCEDLCNSIRGGMLSKIRFIPSRHIAFVTFVDPDAAATFLEFATKNEFQVKGRRLKVGWGQKVNTLPNEVIQAFSSGATRNVYIGGLVGVVDKEKLRQDFSEFGEIELVNIVMEKNCGFVNFTDVLSAVKANKEIRKKPDYMNLVIRYGKDRCANPPRETKSKSDSNPPEDVKSKGNVDPPKQTKDKGNVNPPQQTKGKASKKPSSAAKGSLTTQKAYKKK